MCQVRIERTAKRGMSPEEEDDDNITNTME